MGKKKIGDTRGENPNSLRNLELSRRPKYGERKRQIQLSVTPTAIEGAQQAASRLGCETLSEFVEQFGRGAFALSPSSKTYGASEEPQNPNKSAVTLNIAR